MTGKMGKKELFFFIHVSNTGKTDLLNRTTGVDEGHYVIFSDFSIICICKNTHI